MKELTTEVLIVGAGPSGLLLANDLHRRGISFILVDRAEHAAQESRALFLQALSLEILDELDVLNRLWRKGILIDAVRFYRNRHLETQLDLETSARREAAYPYLLVAEQNVTESVLIQKLREKGANVQRGWEFVRLREEPDQVRSWLKTSNGLQLIRSDYLVGCDGIHSKVRSALEIPFERQDFDQVYHLADLEIQWDVPPQQVVRLVDRQSEVVATPLPGKNRYRLNLWSPGISETAWSLSKWNEILQQLAPCEFHLQNLRGTKSFRVRQGIARSFQQGRGFLVGDAAHTIPQGMAQGLNLGLQDAYNLGWKLALVLRGEAPAELLTSYTQERHPIAQTALVEPPSLESAQWMRFLESQNELDRWAKLCRDSRISPQKGDRAPDGEFYPDSQARYLYERLDGLHYHLLVFSDRPDQNLDRFVHHLAKQTYPSLDLHLIGLGPGADIDVEGCLHRSYAAKHGDLVLLRPDRVVAIRGTVSESKTVLNYLAEHLVESLA